MKIAIYSGSFNPIHNGHLAIAEAALEQGYDEVWMVVSPQNPHKNEEELWPFEVRLHMAQLAVANQNRIKVSDCEITSSLLSTSARSKEICKAFVPFTIAIAYAAPVI